MKKIEQKTKGFRIAAFTFIFFFMFSLFTGADMIWYDQSAANAENLQTYNNYKSDLGADKLITTPVYEFTLTEESISENASTSDTVLLIFNRTVYNALLDDDYTGTPIAGRPDGLLERYYYNLKREYGIIVCTYDGKMDIDTDSIAYNRNISPPDLIRDEIVYRYQHPETYGNLVGCIFIGELPSKWYRYQEDLGDGVYQWIEFPIDLFYMDMDRNLDSGVDNWDINESNQGLLVGYNSTINSIKPEIWVGRITASKLYNDEIPIIQRYLNKNITYRETADLNEDMALIYDGGDPNIILDENFTNPWIDILKNEVYDSPEDVILVRSTNRNNAKTFLTQITNPDTDSDPDSVKQYELVHFGITSSAFTHTFKLYNTIPAYKYLTGVDLQNTGVILERADNLDILAPFFVIAGAGAARFTADDFIGGYYIFDAADNVSKSNGLTLVGSTKSRGIQDATQFYTRLKTRSFGESLWYWIDRLDMNSFNDFNGMTIIGDPTLKLCDEEVKAIRDGLHFISTTSCVRDGRGEISGKEIPVGFRPAIASLAALAYLNWGDTTHEIVVNCIERITTVQADGGWLNEFDDYAYISPARGEGSWGVYNTSCAILPLAAHPGTTAGKPYTNERYRTILGKLRNYLIRCQRSDKGFPYGLNSSSDNSNTQFAVMGIYMASYKLNNNSIPTDIQTNVFNPCADTWLFNTRNADGGHGYRGSETSSNMTAAAAWSYLLCKSDSPELADEDLMALFTLLGENPYDLIIADANNGNYNGGFTYYYAYTIAKALAMRRKVYPFDDNKDWYEELGNSIKSFQNPTTYEWPKFPWISGSNGAAELSTMFCILSLQTQKLDPDDDVYKAYILKSFADLNLYDSRGRLHTGIKDNKIENQIPGSRFIIYRKDDPSKTEVQYEDALNEYGNIGEEYAQEILVWMPNPGKYRIEIVGNSNANHTENPKYELSVETIKEEEVVNTKNFEPIPISGPDEDGNVEVHATVDTIAVIDGAIPEYTEKPEVSAVMKVLPESVEAEVDTATLTASFQILIMETSEVKPLTSVNVYCSNFKDADGDNDIIGSGATIEPQGETISAGKSKTITVTLPVHKDFNGPSSGEVIIESAEGIAKTIPVVIKTNNPPVAEAGEPQIVYGGATGTEDALVTLDGSGSNDPDGDTLTYTWYENAVPIANGVNPTVLLPIGEHIISLIVCDENEACSTPDNVAITVVEAIEGKLWLTPRVVNRNGRGYWVMANIPLPDGIQRENIDLDYKAQLFTDQGKVITAAKQYIWPPQYPDKKKDTDDSRCHVPDKLYFIAWYLRNDIVNEIPEDGVHKFTEVCKLKNGQYLNGKDSITITGKTMRPTRLSIFPTVIFPDHMPSKIKTILTLPRDVKREDVDMNTKITITNLSGESIIATEQYFYPKKNKGDDSRCHYPKYVQVIAYFTPADLLQILPEQGFCELYQECKLVSGNSLVGFANVQVHSKPDNKN